MHAPVHSESRRFLYPLLFNFSPTIDNVSLSCFAYFEEYQNHHDDGDHYRYDDDDSYSHAYPYTDTSAVA